MSAFGTVLKSFYPEAEQAFGFLVREYGLGGPEREHVVIPSVAWTAGSGVSYEVVLETDDSAVVTQVVVDVPGARLIAGLPRLVEAAGLGRAQHVRRTAHTLHSLRAALADQAAHLRRLMPALTAATEAHGREPGGAGSGATALVELMERAGARRWHTQ